MAFFAKGQGAARTAGRAGHVASREWRVYGRRCGPRLRSGPPVHGGPRRGWARAARRASRGGAAIAGSGELTVGALQGTAGHSEGTSGTSEARRVRGARCPCERAGVRWPRGGGGSAAASSSGEAVRAKGRDREGGRSSGEFLTSTRARGSVFVVWEVAADEIQRRQGPPPDGGGGSTSRLGLAWRRGLARVPGGAESSAGPL